MRRGWVVVLLTVALLALPLGLARAQGSRGVDGTVWAGLNADNKLLFTQGYFTGILVFAKYAPGPCTTCTSDCMDEASSKLVPIGSTVTQVVKMIDEIYQEPANNVIPVQQVLNLVAKKAKGMSDEDFKAAVLDARSASAPAQPAETTATAPATTPTP